MGWDKGLPYEVAYRRIVSHLSRSSPPSSCYDLILLIQLRNGLRVSEAVRAFKRFIETKRVELSIPVSKKKRPEERLVVIPREAVDRAGECVEVAGVDDRVLTNRVKNYCRYTFKFNTHTLRYSFITYLLRQGVSPSVIAKITRHSRLDYILTYTQEKLAEDILKTVG